MVSNLCYGWLPGNSKPMVAGAFANLPSQETPLQNGIDVFGELERLVEIKNYVKGITYDYAAKNIMAGGRSARNAANGS